MTEIFERERALRTRVSAANVYHLPRKGYPQDALFAVNKVELRGVKKGIRSFRALTKFTALFAPQKVTEEIAAWRRAFGRMDSCSSRIAIVAASI